MKGYPLVDFQASHTHSHIPSNISYETRLNTYKSNSFISYKTMEELLRAEHYIKKFLMLVSSIISNKTEVHIVDL